jgi:two-component system, OmpR family, response regulator MprA
MQVLVIDDDDGVRTAVRRALVLDGHDVMVADSGQAGLDQLAVNTPDAIILDLGLPDIDGMEVCRRLRSIGDRTPVLMLTARDAVENRVEGLEVGADDYLVKPYDVRELRARIKAIVRRHLDETEEGTTLHFSNVTLDPNLHGARVGDRAVELTRTEYQLLELLMLNPRRVLTSELIYERIWGYDFGLAGNSLRVYIGYLRRKLETGGEPRLIQTIHGVGYVLREP